MYLMSPTVDVMATHTRTQNYSILWSRVGMIHITGMYWYLQGSPDLLLSTAVLLELLLYPFLWQSRLFSYCCTIGHTDSCGPHGKRLRFSSYWSPAHLSVRLLLLLLHRPSRCIRGHRYCCCKGRRFKIPNVTASCEDC